MTRCRAALSLLLLLTLAALGKQEQAKAQAVSSPYNPLTINAAMSASASASANQAAYNAAVAAACPAGFATIVLPPGQISIATPLSEITCSHISLVGAGSDATTFFPQGTGNLISFGPVAGSTYGGFSLIQGFRVYRADSPSAGDGLLLDHAANVVVSNVHVTGSYIDFECIACLNVSFVDGTSADGVESQAGSLLMWFHHVNAFPVTTASTMSGTVIPVNSTAGVYFGQVVSGDANIPAGDTVTAWDAIGLTITLTTAVTGTVGTAETLNLVDNNNASVFLGNVVANSSTTVAPFTYDHAVVVNNADGIKFSGGHFAFTRGSDLLVQPGYVNDKIDNLFSEETAYFDHGGGACIDFEPYGGVTMNTSQAQVSGDTSLTFATAPSVDVTGYSILANGVTAPQTVASGGATATITLSGTVNTLGVANGEQITFYPTYSGTNLANNFAGFCQNPVGDGILLNDPSLIGVKFNMFILNGERSAVHAYAGSEFNFAGTTIRNSNENNASYPDVLIEGNASHVNLSSTSMWSGTHAPPYHISKQGQATYVVASGNDYAGSATNDVIDGSLSTTHTDVGFCTTDNVAALSSTSRGCLHQFVNGNGSNTWATFVTSANGTNELSLQGNNAPGSSAYPVLQESGGTTVKVYSAGAGNTVDILAKGSGAGTINIGGVNSDTVQVYGLSNGGTDITTAQTSITSGIPFVLPSSGSVGNNGALTGITALAKQYASAYVYMPAGAIAAGSADGWYYAVFSSTSAATLYNNVYTGPGIPTIPASPTAFATTGPGAYTQVSTEVYAQEVSVAGNLMGLNGSIAVRFQDTFTADTNSKTAKVEFDGTAAYSAGFTTSTADEAGALVLITNRGATGAQVASGDGVSSTGLGVAASGSGPYFLAVDTTTAQTVANTMTLGTPASDSMVSEFFAVTAQPSSP